MSAESFAPLSPTRRVAQAFAEISAGFIPVLFLLYALLASGCTAPVTQHAPNMKGVLTQKVYNTPNPPGASAGQGSFSALVVLESQPLPSLAATAASYTVPVDATAHSIATGQAVAAQVTDDAGNAFWVLALAANFTGPGEAVMIALPASAFAVGSVNLDGSVAVAYLVDANGNPLAYSSSGTLTLSAAPGAVGGLVIGSFTGSFAVIPAGCQTDADCGRGALCQSGNCVPADCTSLGCPAGMVCDPASLACVPAGCQTDADCGAGLVCRNGSCEVAGCQVTGCPAGYTCDPTSGACFAQPACTTNSDCAAGQQCLRGQCVPGGCTGGTLCNGACVDVSTDPYNCGACGVACARGTACIAGACAYNQGCTVTGCPAGMACDATTGQCVAQPGCVTDADCGRGLFCVSGQCVSSGSCVQYGCPAGYNCDYASGACIPGTPVGSCYFMGTGSFAGNGGGVPMCSAAGLNAVNGGPDAAIFDSQDENGNPAILLAIGDMQGSGDTYLLAVLSACPAAGSVLTGADAQFFLMYQSVTADTAIQVQKTATSGTATFTAGANGALNVSVSAQFGTNTVTGTASVSVGTP